MYGHVAASSPDLGTSPTAWKNLDRFLPPTLDSLWIEVPLVVVTIIIATTL